jgi:tetratricopeptide (TPR) repeat protein
MDPFMRRYFLLGFLLAAATLAQAQERKMLKKGNELYTQKKYREAASAYEQAIKTQPQSVTGHFNLGNAMVQQKQYDSARKTFSQAANDSKEPAVQSGAQYNTGNTYMSQQEWQKAVDAYKQALRKKPGDSDAQYNLSYALAKLKQQQDQQKQQQKQQQKKPEKPKEDKKDQKQQPKDDKQDQQHPQPQPSKLSEQQADNLLKALQQDERRTQDKMQQSKAVPVKLDKDW